MIRKRLESITGKMSDEFFLEVMDATKKDIVVNKILYKKKTSYDLFIGSAVSVVRLFEKCWYKR